MAGKSQEMCAEEFDKVNTWVMFISIIPIGFCLVTIVLLCIALLTVKKMITVCDGISSNAHWLSRTAVRAGIGETARTTITEYAKTKPELHRLLK